MSEKEISIRKAIRQIYIDTYHNSNFIDSEDGQSVLDIMCDRFRLNTICINLERSCMVSPFISTLNELILEFGDKLSNPDFLADVISISDIITALLGYEFPEKENSFSSIAVNSKVSYVHSHKQKSMSA